MDPHREALDEHHRLVSLILTLFKTYDPAHLAPGDLTPEDEYQTEAAEIAGLLTSSNSAARRNVATLAAGVRQIIHARMACDFPKADEFARDIHQALHLKGKP